MFKFNDWNHWSKSVSADGTNIYTPSVRCTRPRVELRANALPLSHISPCWIYMWKIVAFLQSLCCYGVLKNRELLRATPQWLTLLQMAALIAQNLCHRNLGEWSQICMATMWRTFVWGEDTCTLRSPSRSHFREIIKWKKNTFTTDSRLL